MRLRIPSGDLTNISGILPIGISSYSNVAPSIKNNVSNDNVIDLHTVSSCDTSTDVEVNDEKCVLNTASDISIVISSSPERHLPNPGPPARIVLLSSPEVTIAVNVSFIR